MLQIRAVTYGNSIFLFDNDVISNSISRYYRIVYVQRLKENGEGGGGNRNNIHVNGVKKKPIITFRESDV